MWNNYANSYWRSITIPKLLFVSHLFDYVIEVYNKIIVGAASSHTIFTTWPDMISQTVQQVPSHSATRLGLLETCQAELQQTTKQINFN